MAFADFPQQGKVVGLLQRSLGRGRLAHAYLFTGHQMSELGALARTLAKTLNCLKPVRVSTKGPATDCCDRCVNCRKIDGDTHADVHWVRPESKSRAIVIDQMRDLMREIHLKPNDAECKVAIVEAADRMNASAANAFLKTLEEPPSRSIVMLLTTEPQRLLETVVSRCLRLNFSTDYYNRVADPSQREWLAAFGELAAAEQKSLLGRYRLMGFLSKKLGGIKEAIEKSLTQRSPLAHYDDVDPRLREKWEEELAAAIEAEYRLQRADLLVTVQWWLRDVWLRTLSLDSKLLSFPESTATPRLAQRLSPAEAMENLRLLERTQRLLASNVQEALAVEVSLLKLNL